ncbi:amino acid adenylation domain-containing protein [Verticillium dahliae]
MSNQETGSMASQSSSALSISNHPPERLPGPCLLHELVAQRSKLDLPSISSLSRLGHLSEVSYSELHQAADRLATRVVASRGLSPQTEFIVPVLVPQSTQLYIALLAILKAGGAFCPLNLDAPPERIKFILQDVGARVVLTTPELASKVAGDELGISLITLTDTNTALDLVTDFLVAKEETPPINTPEPQSLAYVMYTSGSTGTPKGVGITHDAATQSLLAHDRHIPEFERFLQFASPTFDVSVFEIFFPLFRGCTLVTCDRSKMLDDLPGVMTAMRVDACELTPTVAGSLLRTRASVPSLKLLLTIGEMLTPRVVKEFGGDSTSPSILWGMYGPTEAAIHCTLQTAFSANSSPRVIGAPFDTVSCFVIEIPPDDSSFSFTLSPIGQIGELVVGGYQLAKNYLNRPEQTDAAFIDSPYGRLYRTGDKARMQSDGTLECFGRISDGQVKLRGQRIELGEVEQAAIRDPQCRDAIAMVVDNILVIFCVLEATDSSKELTSESILQTCRQWLPTFMIPGDVVIINEFPRLASGKIDRHQMRREYGVTKNTNTTVTQNDLGPLEKKITTAISNLVGSPVTLQDVLSAHGIDSLRAIQLASALRKEGLQTSPLDVVSSNTISALCTKVRAVDNEAQRRHHIKQPPDAKKILASSDTLQSMDSQIEGFDWCTQLQSSMLFETSANSSAYHNLLELEFPASCSLEQVRNCLEKMVQQNDILRSGFVETGGSFVRVILKSLPKSQIQSVNQFTLSAQQTADDDYESIWLRPFQAQVANSAAGAPPRLLLRMHHAIYDGWTVDLMIQDLTAILAGQEAGPRPQFGQVTAFFNSAPLIDLDVSRAFWAEQLFDWQKPSFPRLMSRPPDSSEPQSMSRTLTLSEGDLEEAAKKLGFHAQVFFQAAVTLIWGTILGTSDVVIGCVSSGRTLPVDGIEDIMGPCIASLPLRTDLRALKTVGDLLRNTQRTNRRSLQHGILPLSEIRRAASIQPGDALYDILFVYQQSLTSHLRHASPIREVSHRDFLETKVLIEIEPVVDSFKCHITYHADAMSPDFATLFLDQIDCITQTLHINPTALLHDVSQCVPPALASIYNPEPVTLADSPDLATCFERSASAAPEADAICFAKSFTSSNLDCETMSYQELNNLSNRIAWYLRSQGVLEGDTVAIVMEKSILLYATILGTLKAGAAYLPLLPSTPASRLQLILSQASTTACLVDQQAIVAVADVVACPLYDMQSTSLSELPTHNPPRQAQPSRPAYIIYTSGTTGVPKGIVVTQLNITSNLDVLSRLYPHDMTSRFLQLCSQAFDVSVFEIFFTWKTGACLCAGSNDTLFADLEQSIRSLGCTHLSLTPTVASLIRPSHVPNVQFLVTAGEPMTSAVSESWGEYLYQGYGPAETTNICTVKKMTKGDYINHLGFAFENVSAFVLSTDSMSSVPRGCFGEFCFGGDQVAQGYIDLPEITSAKFVNHPEFGRIYRSGDMGRMLPDGSLLVTGRLDGQVKLRGQRIETGEIDSIVTAAKEVLSCTSLILQPTGSSSEQLVSFYTPAAHTNVANASFDFHDELAALNQQLFAQLSSRLSRYMVPSYLIPLSTIPQTSSGKVDKAALRSLFNGLTQHQLGLVSNNQEHGTDEDEWSDSERLVAEVIAQSLNVPRDRVSRWQPLATIGLDSISAISVARSLGDTVNRRIPISHILQNPYVALLARLATENAPDERVVEDEATDSPFLSQDIREHITAQFAEHKHAVQEVLPCTPLQEAMLSAAGASSYSNQLVLRLTASSPEMKSHWQTVIDRHDILRTCFVTTTDAQYAIAQVVLQRWEVPLRTSRHPSLEDAVENCRRRVPFALDSQRPPYGLDLLDIDNTFFLVFTCHHALYDGESMSVLLQEIEQLVRGESLPSPIPYTPVIRQMLSPQPSSEGFWKELFKGFVGARRETFINRKQALPLGYTSPPPRPQTYTSQISLGLTAWQKVARDTNTSILALGQATWAILIGIVSGQDDVCFGNVMSGRTLPVSGIERLVAPCFNTVPIRIETNRRMQVTDLLTKLHVLNSKILDHQFASLRSIQKLVSRPGRSLFDTILLLQPPKKDLDSAIWELAEDTGGMDVPLVCELIPNAHTDKVELNLHTNNATLDPCTASSMSQAFSYVLGHIARHHATVIPTRDDLPEDIRSSIANASHESPQNNPDQQESSFSGPSYSATVHKEPWSELEKAIRDILSKLSGVAVSRIGLQTTIFQLGLDSINAVQIATLLRKQDHNVSTFDVVDCPSCASLGQRIARRVGEQSPVRPIYDVDAFQQTIASTVAVQLHTEPEAVFPCTPVQCGMLKDFIESGGVDYLNYLALELDQHLSPEEVENAWRQLVQAHPILRTGFVPANHADAPFAMVQHSFAATLVAKSVTFSDTDFDAQVWKAQSSQQVLNALEQSPWRIALATQGGTTILHLLIHHALYDAYSLHRLLGDLGSILNGSSPPTPTGSTRDVVSAILGSALADESSKAFWLEKSSQTIINRFPTMTPLIEPSSATYTETCRSRLDFATLQSRASMAGVTIQAMLQAAWTRLLSAYVGEQTLVFGVVLSGRTLPMTDDAVFPCITTVPVISHNQASNTELLSQMMQYSSQLSAHQHAPLSKIQQWLGHPGTPLFDTLLVYQKTANGPSSAQKLPWRQISDEGKLDYAVSLEIEPSNDGHISLHLSSHTGVLPRQQASIALRQFDAILADLATNPQGQEAQIWHDDAELTSILPPRDIEIDSEVAFLHHFVEETARTSPDGLALEFVTAFNGESPESHSVTFKELNEMGNRVANTLAQHVASRGIVAVHFDKCPEAFFAILGILKAGCSFLALDPSAPKARKEFILRDSGAVALLARDALDFQPAQIVVEIEESKLYAASAEPCQLGHDLFKNDTCYCLYTSGTTGTPKGCEITHENAVQAIKAFQRLFAGHWDEESRWLQFASFHFDVSVLEQYWSWSVAMPLVVVPRDIILDDIAATIRRLRITHLDLTPSLARLLDPKDVPTLCRGVFITGGEALKQEILDTWGPQGVIYNAYGPTETTIGVTMYQRVPQNGRASNIGRQFDNVGTYVFEPGTEKPVLRGAVGELCISGKLVGKGYLNRPELTAERFPVLEHFKEKIYRTGDLVRVMYDGCFEFLGRADDQVKLRGQRLEIGEINHAIRTGVAAVKDVVTLVTKHPKVDKDLLVTFVTSSEAATSIGELEVLGGAETFKLRQTVLKACRHKLPGYMVPSYVLEVPFIPLSINNKAEMKILRHLFASLTPELLLHVSAPAPSQEALATTKTQKTVLRAVSKFSGVSASELSLNSNLFDLGIDSISCLRLSRLLKQDGLRTADPALVLKNPFLGDLAEALDIPHDHDFPSAVREAQQQIHAFSHRFRHEVRQKLPLPAGISVDYIAPCTPLQEGMLSRTFSQGEESYFVSFQLKLSDNLVASRLQESWDKLVALHPILRTRFVPTSGGFAQVALSPTQIPWKSYTVGQDGVKLLLQEARSSWIKNNQDSILEPMECLVVNSEGDRLLVVHIFHALYDGISFESMLQWLADDISQKPHAQRPAFLDTLSHGPLQNFDHSRFFWSEHLSSCTFEPLPRIITDEAPSLRSVRRLYNVERLREASKALNITLQSAVLSLWSGTFGKSFSPRAAMGVVVSGRVLDIEDVEDVMGPLFNTLPFYPDVATNNTLQKLAQRCHDFNVSTLPFQHTALRNIQKWCSGGHPIFDNLFVYQNDVPLASNAETFWTVEDSFVANDYPLAFEATAKGDADLQVQIVVRQDVATEADVQRILEDFEEGMFALATGRAGTLRNQASALTSQESSAGASPLTTRSASTDSAGHSTDVSAPEFTVSNFGWTEATLAIRFEISRLAQIPVESISECNSLLELGLDSIDIVSLSARLKQKGIDISMSQLLRAQNIESMEKVIGREVPRDSGEKSNTTFDALLLQLHEAVVAAGYDMGTVESVLPPTPLQESMVADMIDSNFERYFNHDVMEISKDTIVESLVDAWLEVISQSPILRTVFLQVDDPRLEQTFCQIALAHHLPSIQHIQLQGEQEIEGVYTAHRQNARNARGASQLLQLTIAHVGDQSYVVFSIAHALYDGWSLALLHQDVDSAYHNMLEQRPSPRNLLQSLLQSPTDKSQRFWSQYLAGAPPSLLPESTTPPTDAIHHDETMSSLSSGEVMAFCKRNSVTLQVLGQACWSTVLATRLGALDVSFGVVLSGRDTEEAQSLMFPTMNTVALRCVLHGSARSFLRYLQDTMSDVYEYQTYPLRRAQLAGKQAPGGLFNTLFLLQRQPSIAKHHTKNVGLAKSVQASATTDFAVCIELEATEDHLVWRVAGKEASTSEHDVKELLEHLDRAMNHFVQRPESSLLQFEGDRTSICHLPAFVSDSQTTMPDSGKDNGNAMALEEPESQVESTIRQILSEVSGIPYESISRDSTAYHLGLDSISLIKVSSILKKKDIMLGVHALLTASSLSHMAKLAGNAPKPLSAEVQEACLIPDRIKLEQVQSLAGFAESQVEDIMPAVPMQVYMMTAWQNSQGGVFYPAFRYQLDESVSLNAVQKAWADLTATETLLRTCLVATGDWDMPFLQIVLAPNVTGPHSQISLLGSGSEKEVASECWPQVRMTAEQRADGVWELTLNIHHALYDGITLPGILDKLRQNVVNNNKKDEQKNPSSRPWRSFIAHHQSPGIIDERKAFWTQYLADAADSAPPPQQTHHSFGDRTAYLRRSAVSGMGTMNTSCASNGVGLPALVFAAVAQSLHARRVPSSEPVIFGIYYSNRAEKDDPATELYPTLNLLPLKVMVQEKTGLMELAQDVQQDLHRITSLANSTVGLWEIKEWTGVAVDVFVNFLNLPKRQEPPDVFHEVVDDRLFNEDNRPTSRASPDPSNFDATWLSKNTVRGAFPAAMDIEAAVNGDALDMGVFGSVARTTIEEAKALVDGIAGCLSLFKT